VSNLGPDRRTALRRLARTDLAQVASAVPVPVLRKDFILDELQLYEARAAGASAVLLIVLALTSDGLRVLARAARDQGLGVLVEAHSGEASSSWPSAWTRPPSA